MKMEGGEAERGWRKAVPQPHPAMAESGTATAEQPGHSSYHNRAAHGTHYPKNQSIRIR